jgi:hypothetical protein
MSWTGQQQQPSQPPQQQQQQQYYDEHGVDNNNTTSDVLPSPQPTYDNGGQQQQQQQYQHQQQQQYAASAMTYEEQWQQYYQQQYQYQLQQQQQQQQHQYQPQFSPQNSSYYYIGDVFPPPPPPPPLPLPPSSQLPRPPPQLSETTPSYWEHQLQQQQLYPQQIHQLVLPAPPPPPPLMSYLPSPSRQNPPLVIAAPTTTITTTARQIYSKSSTGENNNNKTGNINIAAHGLGRGRGAVVPAWMTHNNNNNNNKDQQQQLVAYSGGGIVGIASAAADDDKRTSTNSLAPLLSLSSPSSSSTCLAVDDVNSNTAAAANGSSTRMSSSALPPQLAAFFVRASSSVTAPVTAPPVSIQQQPAPAPGLQLAAAIILPSVVQAEMQRILNACKELEQLLSQVLHEMGSASSSSTSEHYKIKFCTIYLGWHDLMNDPFIDSMARNGDDNVFHVDYDWILRLNPYWSRRQLEYIEVVLQGAGFWIQGQPAGELLSIDVFQRRPVHVGWKIMKKTYTLLQSLLGGAGAATLLQQQRPSNEVVLDDDEGSSSINRDLAVVEICHCLHKLWYGRVKIARHFSQGDQARNAVLMEQAVRLLRGWLQGKKQQQPAAAGAAAAAQGAPTAATTAARQESNTSTSNTTSHNSSSNTDRSGVMEANENWTKGTKQPSQSSAPALSLWPLSVSKNTLSTWPPKSVLPAEDQKPAPIAAASAVFGGQPMPHSSNAINNNTAAQSLNAVAPTAPSPNRQWTSVEWNAKSTSNSSWSFPFANNQRQPSKSTNGISSSSHQLLLPEIEANARNSSAVAGTTTPATASSNDAASSNNVFLQSSTIAAVPRTSRWDQPPATDQPESVPSRAIAATKVTSAADSAATSAHEIRRWCGTIQNRLLENGWPHLNPVTTGAAAVVPMVSDSLLADMQQFVCFMRHEAVKNTIKVEFSGPEKRRKNILLKLANAFTNKPSIESSQLVTKTILKELRSIKKEIDAGKTAKRSIKDKQPPKASGAKKKKTSIISSNNEEPEDILDDRPGDQTKLAALLTLRDMDAPHEVSLAAETVLSWHHGRSDDDDAKMPPQILSASTMVEEFIRQKTRQTCVLEPSMTNHGDLVAKTAAASTITTEVGEEPFQNGDGDNGEEVKWKLAELSQNAALEPAVFLSVHPRGDGNDAEAEELPEKSATGLVASLETVGGNDETTKRGISGRHTKHSSSSTTTDPVAHLKAKLKDALRAKKKALQKKLDLSRLASSQALRPISALLKGALDCLTITNIGDSGPEELVRFAKPRILLDVNVTFTRPDAKLSVTTTTIDSTIVGNVQCDFSPTTMLLYNDTESPKHRNKSRTVNESMTLAKRKLDLQSEVVEAQEGLDETGDSILDAATSVLKAAVADDESENGVPTAAASLAQRKRKLLVRIAEAQRKKARLENRDQQQEQSSATLSSDVNAKHLAHLVAESSLSGLCRDELMQLKRVAEQKKQLTHYKHLVSKQEVLLAKQEQELLVSWAAIEDCERERAAILIQRNEMAETVDVLTIQDKVLGDLAAETAAKLADAKRRLEELDSSSTLGPANEEGLNQTDPVRTCICQMSSWQSGWSVFPIRLLPRCPYCFLHTSLLLTMGVLHAHPFCSLLLDGVMVTFGKY